MFEKGKAKTGGRQVGTKNIATKRLKNFFQAILDENQEQIKEDLQSLEPKDRLIIQMKMAEFVEPKLKAVESKLDIDGAISVPPEYWITQKEWT